MGGNPWLLNLIATALPPHRKQSTARMITAWSGIRSDDNSPAGRSGEF